MCKAELAFGEILADEMGFGEGWSRQDKYPARTVV